MRGLLWVCNLGRHTLGAIGEGACRAWDARSGLDEADNKFVRIAGPGGMDEEPPMETAIVTPAEANDLSGKIRSILGEHLSGANLDTAASAIEASVAAALAPPSQAASGALPRDYARAHNRP